MEEKIDEGLYSRQLYVLGHEAMAKIASSTILISSANGLGTEIAKNILLAGCKKVVIVSDIVGSHRETGRNFYFTGSDYHPKSHSYVLNHTIHRLRELNPYTEVEGITEELQDSHLSDEVDVLVLVDEPLDRVSFFSNICYNQKKKLVVVNSHGLFGFVACDYGDDHRVLKQSDKEMETSVLQQVDLKKDCVVEITLLDDQEISFSSGDFVRLVEIKSEQMKSYFGLGKETTSPVLKVEERTHYSSRLSVLLEKDREKCKCGEETTVNTNCKAEEVDNPECFISAERLPELLAGKKPEKVSFIEFSECEKLKIFTALLETMQLPGKKKRKRIELPKPHKLQYVYSFYKSFAEKYKEMHGEEVKESDLQFILKTIRCLITQLVGVNSFLGSVAAQEVIKLISHKFTPMNQVLFFDCVDVHPECEFVENADKKRFEIKGMTPNQVDSDFRYHGCALDDLYNVLGREVVEKMQGSNVFMVGAGAIGCELIKNLALSGFCHGGHGGTLSLTDDDVIERSNLNRQFLFRPKDINRSKAEVASAKATEICENMKVDWKYARIEENTCTNRRDEDGKIIKAEFSVQDFESFDLILTALDNIEARNFVDQKSVLHGVPMIDSGTLGCRGNTQSCVPHKTENYGASSDPVEKGIAVCTLKHYPYKPEHVVVWGQDKLLDMFKEGVESLKRIVQAKGELDTSDDISALLDNAVRYLEFSGIKSFSTREEAQRTSENFLKDVTVASANNFCELFVNAIKQLVHNFPKDSRTKSGGLFWSGTKRFPTAATFDMKDEMARQFMVASVRLNCATVIEGTKNEDLKNKLKEFIAENDESVAEAITKNLEGVELKQFEPKKVDIPEDDSEMKEKEDEDKYEMDEDAILEDLKKLDFDFLQSLNLVPLEFEKDDDSNYHMSFITASTNLRAFNYSLDIISQHECKKIAGKIIPAIATTTALVSGLVTLEAIKSVQGKEIGRFRNSFVNLSIPIFAASEPMAPEVVESVKSSKPFKFTVWDSIEFQEKFTLGEFKEKVLKECEWKIKMLTFRSFIIYSLFSDQEVASQRDKMKISDILKEKKLLFGDLQGEQITLELLVEAENEPEEKENGNKRRKSEKLEEDIEKTSIDEGIDEEDDDEIDVPRVVLKL